MWKELTKINRGVKSTVGNRKYFLGRFLPNRKIMFVAEMSTIPRRKEDYDPTNNFYIGPTDKKFVRLLNKHGLGGSYITDIVKIANPVMRLSSIEKTVKDHSKFLIKEVEAIKPSIIVALGDDAHKRLRELFPHQSVRKIMHPARIRWVKNGWKKYEKQIKGLAKVYNQLKHDQIL